MAMLIRTDGALEVFFYPDQSTEHIPRGIETTILFTMFCVRIAPANSSSLRRLKMLRFLATQT